MRHSTLIIFALCILAGCNTSSKIDQPSKTDERSDRIRLLIENIQAERRALWSQNIVDGNGYLYRGTSSFNELKKICTAEELGIVDIFLGPPTKKATE